MAGVSALLVILLAVPAAYATDYMVGDSSGWSTGVDYKTWASGKTFGVGDNLIFAYTSMHSLDEVTKTDYDSCSATTSIQSYSDGNTTIPLTKAGPRYFMCPAFSHCGQGMKLAVTVSPAAASGGSTTPTVAPVPAVAPAASTTNPESPADATNPSKPAASPTATATPLPAIKRPSSSTPSTHSGATKGVQHAGGLLLLVGLGLAFMS